MTSTTAVDGASEASEEPRHPAAIRHAELLEFLAARVIASKDAPRRTIHTPLTGEVVGTLPTSSAQDVERAFAAARAAQVDWARRSPKERAKVLKGLAELVINRQDEGCDLAQLETGKSRIHAFDEIAEVAINARWLARRAPKILRRGLVPGLTPVTWSTTVHHPKGVVGIISPWNYPYILSISDAVAALVAGNAVVLKPDSQTPFTALWGVQQLVDAGLPEGLFQIVYGSGRELGTPLIDRSDYVCFTGSTATGRVVAEQAARRLIGCSLELGGKNAVYVAADANLDRAAEGVLRDCFGNTGHTCISMERLLLHEKIADPFLKKFIPLVSGLKLGSGLDYDSDIGSIASRPQFDILVEHVEDAIANGAEVLIGGKARPEVGPLFFEPTVLDKVPSQAICSTTETFGPLVNVRRVADDDEAIAVMNETEFGLHASVWSGNRRHGNDLAARVETGTVGVNEAYTVSWASVAAPMGGRKNSGIGRRHGVEGVLRFTETQSIIHQHLMGLKMILGSGGRRYSKVFSFLLRLTKASHYPWP